MNCVNEYKVCDNDRHSLEENGGATAVVEVGNSQHVWVKVHCDLRQEVLKPAKQGGVVKGPLRGFLKQTKQGSYLKQHDRSRLAEYGN